MKKTLLSFVAIAGLSALSFGQIEIYVDGGTTNYSGGGVLQVSTADGAEMVHEIDFENHSGGSMDWVVSRKRINDPAEWNDYLCFGHETDNFGGTCFSESQMDMAEWTCSAANSVTVADGEHAFIASHIFPSTPINGATVTYRYFVGTEQNPFMDSMDVEVSSTLSLEEIAPTLTVNVAPNPASDYVKVSASGVNNATVKMIDVLGNVIMKKPIYGSKTINVAEFRNGIYFIIVEAPGVKTVNRKVVVRH